MCIVYPEKNPEVYAALPSADIFVILCETKGPALPRQDGSDPGTYTGPRLPPMLPVYAPVCGTFLLAESAVGRATELMINMAEMMDANARDLERVGATASVVRVFGVLTRERCDLAVICQIKRIEAKGTDMAKEEFGDVRLLSGSIEE